MYFVAVFVTVYALFGSLFLSKFYSENFTLYINGNGGFVGNYLSENFLVSLLNRYEDFSYYLLSPVSMLTLIFYVKIIFVPLKKTILMRNVKTIVCVIEIN